MKVSSPLEVARYSDLILTAIKVVITFTRRVSDNPRPESNGGYFTLRSASTGLTLLSVPIGEMPPEKIDRYFKLSFALVHEPTRWNKQLADAQ